MAEEDREITRRRGGDVKEPTEKDLLSRMLNFEDNFVERKTSGDSKDWVKTVVAFANSAPDGHPCVLYIGVKDTGNIETPQVNLDSLQKTFNRGMEKIYPRVVYLPKIIEENGKQALAVIVLGSELRPHFSGPSYVRKGPITVEASEEQFAELIARRNSKANRILSFKGKAVTVVNRQERLGQPAYESEWPSTVVAGCDQFLLTLETQPGKDRHSFPLSRVEINFDNVRNRLLLEITR